MTFVLSVKRIEEYPFAVDRLMANPDPTVVPEIQRSKAGFTSYAERLNGRAAMVGFIAVLIIEYFTGKGLLTWLGLV